MESFLPENKDDERDDYHSSQNDDEIANDLLFESLPSDEEWNLEKGSNEEDTGFASSSSTSSSSSASSSITADVNTANTTNSQDIFSIFFSSSASPSCPPYPISTYFSEEPLGDDVNLRPLKKRRHRNRPREHLFPRILKHDTRRLLPQMYFNAMNSGDKTLYQRFLSDFCVGSCCVMDNLDDSSLCPILKEMKPLTVRGLDNVSNILTKRIFSLPDFVCRVEKSWVRHQLNTPGSALIAKVRMQGTLPRHHLIDMPKTPYGLPYFIVDALKMTGRLPKFMKRLDDHATDDEQNKQDGIAPFYDSVIEAYSIFHVDNDNRIYRFELHGRLQVHPVSM
eukprot:scaffold760_cov178-Ochromonas_danica.AAC.8